MEDESDVNYEKLILAFLLILLLAFAVNILLPDQGLLEKDRQSNRNYNFYNAAPSAGHNPGPNENYDGSLFERFEAWKDSLEAAEQGTSNAWDSETDDTLVSEEPY